MNDLHRQITVFPFHSVLLSLSCSPSVFHRLKVTSAWAEVTKTLFWPSNLGEEVMDVGSPSLVGALVGRGGTSKGASENQESWGWGEAGSVEEGRKGKLAPLRYLSPLVLPSLSFSSSVIKTIVLPPILCPMGK